MKSDTELQEKEIMMFEERQSQRSQAMADENFDRKAYLKDNDELDYEERKSKKNETPGTSQAQETEVTDEKLFLESTGFGQPKHLTKDAEDNEDENPDGRA